MIEANHLQNCSIYVKYANCNDWGYLFPKLSNSSTYAKHACSTFYVQNSHPILHKLLQVYWKQTSENSGSGNLYTQTPYVAKTTSVHLRISKKKSKRNYK